MAIAVGLALAGTLAAAVYFGPYTTMLLIVVLALLAVLELYNAMRMAGLCLLYTSPSPRDA